MTLLGGLLSVTNSVEDPRVPLTSTSLLDFIGGGSTAAGVRVTEKTALGLPAVWRAVNLIGGGSASLPLHAYRSGTVGRVQVTTGRVADLLDEPHPDLTPFELWEMVFAHLLLWGNAYVRILRDPLGTPRQLWPLHPARVRAGRDSDTGRKIYAVDGGEELHTDDSLLHIPGFGYDGVCGVSPIRAARQGLALALAAEEYGAKLFANGSLASGILQTEQRLTQRQADSLAARWKSKRTGLSAAHDTIVLDKGASFKQLSIPPDDAQFLETRGFQISEVARMFGVPSHMLMDTAKSTSWGAGIEQQSIGFVVYTLRPWLTRVEQRVSRLLPEGIYAKFAVEGLLRGDSAQRAAFYKAMWEIGAYSTDDVLALEDRPPVKGGSTRYRPLNMGELGTTDNPTTGSTPSEGDPADA